jgi:hypothetical protein
MISSILVSPRGVAREVEHVWTRAQQPRAGVPEHVGDFRRVQHEVDRHQHGASARDRETQRCEGVRVARQDRDTIAGTDTRAQEAVRKPIADGIELGVGPLRRAADDGGLVGTAYRGAPQQVSQRVTPDRRAEVGGWR